MQRYSVLMSVYKKEKPEFLKMAMESIFNQTIKTNDFVLVCDGELTEELDYVINEFKKIYGDVLNVIRFKKNRGLALALNDGIKYCKNDLIARMDSDDIAPEYRCELQLKKFFEDKTLEIVGGAITEFEGSPENIVSKKIMPETHNEIIKYAAKRCPFNHPTVMYRKKSVVGVGGYPAIPFHEDYALWVNLLLNNANSCNLPDVLCNMRVDAGLYDRRGGFKYFIIAVKFRWYLYKIGFYNFFKMLCIDMAFFVVCLVPTSVRKKLYKIFLRKGK